MFSSSHLHVPGGVEVEVHPVVLFSVVDHYSRREEGQGRVIGTLLGTVTGNKVEIFSCFPVPHTESEEQVAVNTDFHATMLSLYQRVQPSHQVVGWYSTGDGVSDSSLLFHDFYGQDVERPVHLLVDLGLGTRRMSCKAYVSKQLSLGGATLGTSFEEVRAGVVMAEADRVGMEMLFKSATASGFSGAASLSDADSMEVTIKKLLKTLQGVGEYVDEVASGAKPRDAELIGLLQTAMAAAPALPPNAFGKVFSSQVQDMLVAVYLANLTRAQLALAEKLQAVAI